MNKSTNIGDNLFPFLGTNKGYEDWIKIENRHHKNEFFQKFDANNFIALVGKCGLGKSFFLRNELVPQLKDGYAKNGADNWKVIEITKTRYPLTRLCNELAELAKFYAHEEKINPNLEAEFYEQMLSKPYALVDILQGFFAKETFNLLILADKIDELFSSQLITDKQSDKELLIFSQQIDKAISQRAFPINFVCSIDEKHISKLVSYDEMYSLVTKNALHFRPFENDDILLYLNKITDNFFVNVHESIISELLNLYSKGTIVLAQLIQSLNSAYTVFLNNDKAEATIEQSHYKLAGSISSLFDKSFKRSLNSLSESDRVLLSNIVSLIFYNDQEHLYIKSARSSDLSILLGTSTASIGNVLSSVIVNGQPLFLMANADLVESKLEILSDEHNNKRPIDSSEIYICSSIIINHLNYIKKSVLAFDQNAQKLAEISKDVYHRESYYRDEKQAKVYSWFKNLWFTPKIGKFLIDNYEEVVRFIEESYLEEERRRNRIKAEEQSRLAKEKRFKVVVISSAFIALILVVISVYFGYDLKKKMALADSVELELSVKTESLNKIQAQADSALRSVDILTEEFKSKEIETRKKSLELEVAKNNIQVQSDNLDIIKQSLIANVALQAKMLVVQDSLEAEALDSIELANTAKEEAAFTSAINRINSMIFAGGQLIRNRNIIDQEPLIKAVQQGLNAYDSLVVLRKTPYATLIDPSKYEQTEQDLYSHLTISYSQLNTSSAKNVFKPIKQSRSLSMPSNSVSKVFVGTNTGELLRVDLKELKFVTENILIDRQIIPIPNAQIRYSINIDGEKKTLLVLSDGRIVLFDFFYGTIIDLYNDQNVGMLPITSPIYLTKENTYITLFKGKILEFMIKDGKEIKSVYLSKIGESTDKWLKFSYDSTTNLAYVREDVKSLSVYAKSRLNGKFEKLEQKYFDELKTDISYVKVIPATNKLILGLQNGRIATINTSDEGKKIDRSSLNFKISGQHENAVISMSLNQKMDLIATAGTDGRVLVWDVNRLFSNESLISFKREIFDVQAVHSTYFIDDLHLITASSAFKFDEDNRDGQVVLWPLKLDELAAKVRQLMQINSLESENKFQTEQSK
jgi:hypothetical protein